jgi:hypothetical protein
MGRIIDYQIVEASFMTINEPAVRSLLVDRVKEQIANGWEPLGGVAVDSDSLNFFQAMVLRESN